MEKVNLPKVEEATRTELNIIKAQRRDGSLNDTLQGLIEDSKAVKNLTENNNVLRMELAEAKKKIKELEKENHVMRELREVMIPIPREVMNSTPEEIDSLDLSDLKLEDRLKTCWKRFANFKDVE